MTEHDVAMRLIQLQLNNFYWSIYTLDRAAKHLGVVPEGASYEILRSMHQMRYGEMPSDMKANLHDWIKDALKLPADYSIFPVKTSKPKQTFMQKIKNFFGG